MELRQLRYFVRVVELGSMGRAAVDLGVVTSALSQQISRLESELATRLLQRTSTGVLPTDAGLAFLHQAQLALWHAQDAVHAAQQAIAEVTGLTPELSTSGGTSDGRFIAQLCPQVVEIGPPNSSIHKIDERIALADIEPLKDIYRRLLDHLAAEAASASV